MNTSLSENVNSLSATVTALELEANSSLTTTEGLDFPIDDNSCSGEEPLGDAETSTPNSSSTNVIDTDEESISDDVVDNLSTTVAEQVQMHCGINHKINSNDESNVVNLSPVDYATLDVLKLCHDAGCSLEFYDIMFALLRRHFQEQSGHHQASKTRNLSEKPSDTDLLANAYDIPG